MNGAQWSEKQKLSLRSKVSDAERTESWCMACCMVLTIEKREMCVKWLNQCDGGVTMTAPSSDGLNVQ